MLYDALEHLVRLRDSGALTQEEFEQQKQILIDEGSREQPTVSRRGFGPLRRAARRIRETTNAKHYIIAACLAAILITAGIVTYTKIAAWRAEEAAREAEITAIKRSIAEQTAGSSNILKSEYLDTGISYSENFKNIDDRLEKIEATSVSIQTSSLDKNLKNSLSEYLDALSSMLRILKQKDRKFLSFKSSTDVLTSALEDYTSSPFNYYTNDWEVQRLSTTQEEATHAMTEWKEAVDEFDKKLKDLKKIITKNRPILQEYALLDTISIDKAIKRNSETREQLK